MKALTKIILGISISYPLSGLADTDLPAPPPLSDYMASEAPKPPFRQRVQENYRYLRHFYISGKAGYSNVRINDIKNETPPIAGLPVPPVIKIDTSEGNFTPRLAIGYQFRKSGILDRIEIEYSQRSDLEYKANPFLDFGFPTNPNEINSDINNYTLLAKGYWDFDLGYPVVPFIQGGAGVTRNASSGSALFPQDFLPPGADQASISGAINNFAWDVGAGANVRFNDNFWVGIEYEFDSLGQAKWEINNPLFSVPLRSDHVYANSVMASITWIPVA